MKIDLHLVSWFRPEMTELVIKTIQRNTKRDNYRLVVLDNASTRYTQHMLEDLVDDGYIDDLILMQKNIGLEPARTTLLFEETYSPYFICIDNDCLPPPMIDGKDWIERLVDLMEKYEDYGAISCRPQVLLGTGNIFEEADREGTELVDYPYIGGTLRIMRTQQTREIGGWRDSYGLGKEGKYICGRLHNRGYKTAYATNIRTLHLFGTRGEGGTDRWGYNKHWKPATSGHANVYHPALEKGDEYEEVVKFCGEELTKEYFYVDSSNT